MKAIELMRWEVISLNNLKYYYTSECLIINFFRSDNNWKKAKFWYKLNLSGLKERKKDNKTEWLLVNDYLLNKKNWSLRKKI